jgi:hypothetical protein
VVGPLNGARQNDRGRDNDATTIIHFARRSSFFGALVRWSSLGLLGQFEEQAVRLTKRGLPSKACNT